MPPRVGTSGWSYRWWWGRFYPRATKPGDWLSFYARRFDAVELNASFYRLPPPERFAHWRDAVPDGFLFAVKAPRVITHLKKLRDCAQPLRDFLQAAAHLRDRLGPILFQLPPSLHLDLPRLEAFLHALPRPLPNNATPVFEFRHESWFTPALRTLLDAHAAAFCVHDHGGLATPRWRTGPMAYWRFHGTGERGKCYGEDGLKEAAAHLASLAMSGTAVFAFFNNDANACAVQDAEALRKLLQEESATG